MSEDFNDILRLQVPCNAAAPRLVRRALVGRGEIARVREDALLVASELVTNAVLHSGCASGEPLEVAVSVVADGVRISVDDPGTSGRRVAPRERPAGAGGWGLRLVGELAGRWGAERCGRTRVWAELALPTA